MIDLKKILEKEPNLTAFGIDGPNDDHSVESFDIDQIEKSIKWLSTKKIRRNINFRRSSYTYKHFAEDAMHTYISNGNFIAAVIHMGIPYKKLKDSRNIYLPISLKYSSEFGDYYPGSLSK